MEPLSLTLRLNGRSVFFCKDTGTGVTIISEKAYANIGTCSPELKTLDKMLEGPSGDQLACKGSFIGYLQKGSNHQGGNICDQESA